MYLIKRLPLITAVRLFLNGGTYTRSQEKGTSEEDSGSNSYYTILNHGTMTINEGVTINQGADGAGKFSSLIENRLV